MSVCNTCVQSKKQHARASRPLTASCAAVHARVHVRAARVARHASAARARTIAHLLDGELAVRVGRLVQARRVRALRELIAIFVVCDEGASRGRGNGVW
eukprot:822804-Prymnesium_polylepis.1